MFSVLFPGQGSQSVGMIRDIYDNFDCVKNLFEQADDSLNISLSKIIFEGSKSLLDETENTQPAIFLVGYVIYNVIKKETKSKSEETVHKTQKLIFPKIPQFTETTSTEVSKSGIRSFSKAKERQNYQRKAKRCMDTCITTSILLCARICDVA